MANSKPQTGLLGLDACLSSFKWIWIQVATHIRQREKEREREREREKSVTLSFLLAVTLECPPSTQKSRSLESYCTGISKLNYDYQTSKSDLQHT